MEIALCVNLINYFVILFQPGLCIELECLSFECMGKKGI